MHWTPESLIAVLGALVTLIAAITTAAVKIIDAIKSLQRDVNGRMDQLVDTAREAGHAKGRVEGRTEGRHLADADAAAITARLGAFAEGQLLERDARNSRNAALPPAAPPVSPEKSDGEVLAEKHGYGP